MNLAGGFDVLSLLRSTGLAGVVTAKSSTGGVAAGKLSGVLFSALGLTSSLFRRISCPFDSIAGMTGQTTCQRRCQPPMLDGSDRERHVLPDLFLVQAVPELCGRDSTLPPASCVGSCQQHL